MLRATGNKLIISGGKLADNTGPCCCDGTIILPPLCLTEATCNQWCDPSYAAFDRAMDCDCPCNKRRDYPPLYILTWDGFGVVLGSRQNRNDPADGTEIATDGPVGASIAAIVSPGGSSCYSGNNTYIYRQDAFHADDSSDGTYGDEFGDIAATFTIETSDCGRFITFTGELTLITSFPRGVAGPIVTITSGPVDRCSGGSGGSGTINQDIGNSVGSLSWTPTCRDCEDNSVVDKSRRASVCSYEFDAVITLPDGDGGSDRTHVYRLFGGTDGCTWNGADQYGNTGGIICVNGNPDDDSVICCPEHDISNDCDCANNPSSCPGCFKLTLEDGENTYEYFSQGTCPNTSWTRLSGTEVSLDSSGFQNGCTANGSCNCPDAESVTVTISDWSAAGCCPLIQTTNGYAQVTGGTINGTYTVSSGDIADGVLFGAPADRIYSAHGTGVTTEYHNSLTGCDATGDNVYSTDGCYIYVRCLAGTWSITVLSDLNLGGTLDAYLFQGSTSDQCDEGGALGFTNTSTCGDDVSAGQGGFGSVTFP